LDEKLTMAALKRDSYGLVIFIDPDRDQGKRRETMYWNAPRDTQCERSRQSDPRAGETAWPAIHKDHIGAAIARQTRDHRNEMLRMPSADDFVPLGDDVVPLGQRDRTGSRRGGDREVRSLLR
jgi:hypothetical protein